MRGWPGEGGHSGSEWGGSLPDVRSDGRQWGPLPQCRRRSPCQQRHLASHPMKRASPQASIVRSFGGPFRFALLRNSQTKCIFRPLNYETGPLFSRKYFLWRQAPDLRAQDGARLSTVPQLTFVGPAWLCDIRGNVRTSSPSADMLHATRLPFPQSGRRRLTVVLMRCVPRRQASLSDKI